MATLGERLNAVRERKGLTQGEVARRSGLPQQAISRLECGERLHVRSDVLARLALALDVSADVLLGLWDTTTGEAVPSATRPREDAQKTTPPTQRRRTRQAAPVA